MILGGLEIQRKIDDGLIFITGTSDDNCVKEASYALRIAGDGLVLNEQQYGPGTPFPVPYIEIEPGRIAILSTMERIRMPDNLV